MQFTNLELFSDEDLKPSMRIQEQTINSEKLPSKIDKPSHIEQTETPQQLFNGLFLEPSEQTRASKARKILGEKANNITDKELETFTAKLDYLTNSWLDLYEKQLFEGKTLGELTKSKKYEY